MKIETPEQAMLLRPKFIGRAKIRKGVRPYGGRWAPLTRETEKIITVFIQPTERDYYRHEIERIESGHASPSTPQETLK